MSVLPLDDVPGWQKLPMTASTPSPSTGEYSVVAGHGPIDCSTVKSFEEYAQKMMPIVNDTGLELEGASSRKNGLRWAPMIKSLNLAPPPV